MRKLYSRDIVTAAFIRGPPPSNRRLERPLPDEVLDGKVISATISAPYFSEALPVPYDFLVRHLRGEYACRVTSADHVSDLDFRRLLSEITVGIDYPLGNAVLTRRCRGALGYRDPFFPKGHWSPVAEREASLDLQTHRGSWRYPLSRRLAEAIRRLPYVPETAVRVDYHPRLDPSRRTARDRFFPDAQT